MDIRVEGYRLLRSGENHVPARRQAINLRYKANKRLLLTRFRPFQALHLAFHR